MSWNIVVDTWRSLEDFDYWERYDRYNSWHYVFNPIYTRSKESITIIDGALFISEKEIIF